MGYFFGDFVQLGIWGICFGWFWVGFGLFAGLVGLVGFIFNWGNGLLASLLEGWCVLVGLFWLVCPAIQTKVCIYVFSCLW